MCLQTPWIELDAVSYTCVTCMENDMMCPWRYRSCLALNLSAVTMEKSVVKPLKFFSHLGMLYFEEFY